MLQDRGSMFHSTFIEETSQHLRFHQDDPCSTKDNLHETMVQISDNEMTVFCKMKGPWAGGWKAGGELWRTG